MSKQLRASKASIYVDRLCQHYLSLNFPKGEALRLSRLIGKWYIMCGEQFVVDRIKSLADYFSAILEDGNALPPSDWKARRNRKGVKILSDHFLHRLSRNHSRRGLKMARGFVRSHQLFVSDKITKKQAEKFINAVTSPLPKGGEAIVKKLSDVIEHQVKSEVTGVSAPYEPLRLWSISSSKRSPVFSYEVTISDRIETSVSASTAPRSDPRTLECALLISHDKATRDYFNKHPERCAEALFGHPYLQKIDTNTWTVDAPAGTISFIGEPGLKLRTVANPHLCYQALGEPLKRNLEYLIQRTSGVYTFNQNDGRFKVAEWLKKGKKVWCFDASSWTDRFPVELQRATLRRLIKEGSASQADLDLIDLVCSKAFSISKKRAQELGIDSIKWAVGQPMGLGPSFHLATTTHRDILYALAHIHSLGSIEDQFVIVGDDIAICHPQLAVLYADYMNAIGVEINLTKSLISDKFAEFCGKLIDLLGPIEAMKTKFIDSPEALARNLSFYGPKSVAYLSEKELAWATLAILPVPWGGLGLVPSSMKYSDFLAMFDTEVKAIEELSELAETGFQLTHADASSIGKALELQSNFYAANSYGFSSMRSNGKGKPPSLVRQFTSGTEPLSDWTGLPASFTETWHGSYHNYRERPVSVTNTWSYRYDLYTRLAMLESRKPKRLRDDTGESKVTSTPCVYLAEDWIGFLANSRDVGSIEGIYFKDPYSPFETKLPYFNLPHYTDKESCTNDARRKAERLIRGGRKAVSERREGRKKGTKEWRLSSCFTKKVFSSYFGGHPGLN